MTRLVFNACFLVFDLVVLMLFMIGALGPAEVWLSILFGLLVGNAIGANVYLVVDSWRDL